jgi:cytochrome c-type biogenesis protein CcmE
MQRRKLKYIVGALLVIAIGIGIFVSVSSKNLTYYYTPSEVLKSPAEYTEQTIRVMGLVEEGSVKWQPEGTRLSFRISDDEALFLSVEYIGAKPDMFKENQGVVVEGKLTAKGLLMASTLLVKHSEEYKVKDDKADKQDYYDSLKL